MLIEADVRLGYRLPPSSNPDLDYLLAQVAEAVQLTPKQHEKAEGHYVAVSDWLAAPESPLARFAPRIYAQGSMALETTVKPRARVEHDLDFVCLVAGDHWRPMDLYESVAARLGDHGTYAAMLKPKNRCLCLEYSGDFHLDIIPAVRDPDRGGTSLLVPDRRRKDWTPSNPKGYVGWFRSRSVLLLRDILARADAEPLPPQRDADQKPPLTVAVQLIKRARDVLFNGEDAAPRSILLTTLAAHHYAGGTCVATTILDVLRGIGERIRSTAPKMIEVENPTNPSEKFTDGMTPERADALAEFVATLEARMSQVLQLRGVERLRAELEKLFGDKPVATAVDKYAEMQKGRRDSGSLTYSSAGLGLVAPAGTRTVPRNTYFGE